MARGSLAKISITEKIFETFPNAFKVNDKEIRVPVQENGETVEIKISLTCAKDVIGGAEAPSNVALDATAAITPPTEAEVQDVRNLIQELGL